MVIKIISKIQNRKQSKNNQLKENNSDKQWDILTNKINDLSERLNAKNDSSEKQAEQDSCRENRIQIELIQPNDGKI